MTRFMARPAGLEPATIGFEVHYSIQLSYGRSLFSKIYLLKQLLSTFNNKSARQLPDNEENNALMIASLMLIDSSWLYLL